LAIDRLGLRKGARFIYEYDLNAGWCHEIRIEDRLDPDPLKPYPACLDGHGACPPEDCGGPAGYLERRDDVLCLDAVGGGTAGAARETGLQAAMGTMTSGVSFAGEFTRRDTA